MRMHAIYYVLFARAKEIASRMLGATPAPVKRVGEIIAARRPDRQVLYCVPETASALDALQLMHAHSVTAVAVLDGSGRAEGFLTQSDFLGKVALAERPPRATPAASLMVPFDSPSCAWVCTDNTVQDAINLMAYVGCHHLPVMSDAPPAGRLLGIVSLPELMGLTRELRQTRAASRLPDSARGLTLPSSDTVVAGDRSVELQPDADLPADAAAASGIFAATAATATVAGRLSPPEPHMA